MLSKYVVAILALSTTLSACGQTPAVAETPSDPRVNALVERTLKQLVFLKGGTFEMGDWGGPSGLPYDMERDSKPLHKVTLDSFSIMAYQATYDDFDVFTDTVGEARINMDYSYGRKNRSHKRHAAPNWYGAKAYCQWLGQQTKLPFDLATEAQWEYAARAGGQRLLYATDNGKIDRGRNFPPKWENDPEPLSPEVGSYPPNPAGLYGMNEGATEWVNDWYAADYYMRSPAHNPQGPESGTEKVLRGSTGVPAEAANMVFMRGKETPRTRRSKITDNFKREVVEMSGYGSLPDKAVRCVVNQAVQVR